jgi:hypothetical protein
MHLLASIGGLNSFIEDLPSVHGPQAKITASMFGHLDMSLNWCKKHYNAHPHWPTVFP